MYVYQSSALAVYSKELNGADEWTDDVVSGMRQLGIFTPIYYSDTLGAGSLCTDMYTENSQKIFGDRSSLLLYGDLANQMQLLQKATSAHSCHLFTRLILDNVRMHEPLNLLIECKYLQ